MKSMKKGFTLIELLIVIAIIAIVAVIAIPNLMASRIQVNEAAAVEALKLYAEKQKEFQEEGLGRFSTTTLTGDNGFADNFRNLYYAAKDGETSPMKRIPKSMADAYATGNLPNALTTAAAIAVSGDPEGPNAPHQGYYFFEPTNLEGGPGKFYATNFALVAVPSNSSSTGTKAFWVDQEGIVYMRKLDGNQTFSELVISLGGATPSKPTGANDYANWSAH